LILPIQAVDFSPSLSLSFSFFCIEFCHIDDDRAEAPPIDSSCWLGEQFEVAGAPMICGCLLSTSLVRFHSTYWSGKGCFGCGDAQDERASKTPQSGWLLGSK